VSAGTANADGLLRQGCCQIGAVGGRVQSGVCFGKPVMIVKDGPLGTAWQTLADQIKDNRALYSVRYLLF
jgi:hypothetical protein